MAKLGQRILLGKVFFKGHITLRSGLYIGASEEAAQIGGTDSLTIKDSATDLPYIPGSSLKGKLRSTIEKIGSRMINETPEKLTYNRNIGTKRNEVFIHCCDDIRFAINCEACRIFGSTAGPGSRNTNFPAQLIVRDCMLDRSGHSAGTTYTEIKTETGIDRISKAANPRKVERVLPGNKFLFEMVYTVEVVKIGNANSPIFQRDHLTADLSNLLQAMEIIESEGIGGSTTRGYGKIQFSFSHFYGKTMSEYRTVNPEEDETIADIAETSEEDENTSILSAKEKIDDIVNKFEKEAENVIKS